MAATQAWPPTSWELPRHRTETQCRGNSQDLPADQYRHAASNLPKRSRQTEGQDTAAGHQEGPAAGGLLPRCQCERGPWETVPRFLEHCLWVRKINLGLFILSTNICPVPPPFPLLAAPGPCTTSVVNEPDTSWPSQGSLGLCLHHLCLVLEVLGTWYLGRGHDWRLKYVT